MGQKNQLWWDLPAEDTFLLNKEIYAVEDSLYKKTVSELLDVLDVHQLIHVPVRKLSLGERMKMELIASLVHRPKIVFLDEPTIGLDVVMQKKLRDFIKKYNEKYRATILLTSHYMTDVEKLAKRVIVIDKGTILYDGSLDALVRKFSDYKFIDIVTASPISRQELEKFGDVISTDAGLARIQVTRKNTTDVAAVILKTFSVEDISIVDPDIEDIIRDVFTSKG